MARFEYSENPYEGMTVYAPAFLESQPTLSVGQAADLKLETGGRRYWLARGGPGDGEEWQVHVEHLREGRWEPLVSYREAE